MAEQRSGYISIYIAASAVIGGAVGLLFGALFDAVIPGRRTLAVLAALAAIVAELAARRHINKAFPQVFAPPRSMSITFISIVIALAGGLATHDLGLIWNVMSGPILGLFSGLFASLMTSILMVIKAEESRHGVEKP